MKTVEDKVKEILEELNKIEHGPDYDFISIESLDKPCQRYGRWRSGTDVWVDIAFLLRITGEHFGQYDLKVMKKKFNNRRLRIYLWVTHYETIERKIRICISFFEYFSPSFI